MGAIAPSTSAMLLSKGRIFGLLQMEESLRGRALRNGLINGGNEGAIAPSACDFRIVGLEGDRLVEWI